MQERFGMSNIEANDTTYGIGEHNNARDCEWRILAVTTRTDSEDLTRPI
jgi:hypothetical protein